MVDKSLFTQKISSQTDFSSQKMAILVKRLSMHGLNYKYTSVIEFGQQTHAIAIEFTLELLLL